MKLRKFSIFTAVLAVIALVSGCMKMEVSIVLHEDDTASGYMIFAYDKEVLEQFGTSAEEALESMELDDSAPEDAIAEAYDDGKYIGQKYSFERTPLVEATGSDMSVTREGNNFVVKGELDLSDEDEDLGEMMDSMIVRYAVTFPGQVIEHDGRLDGTTVIWDATPGEITPINAVGVASGSGQPPADLGGSDSPSIPDDNGTTDTPEDTPAETPDDGDADDGAADEPETPAETPADADADSDSDSSKDGGIPMWLWFVLGGVGLLVIIIIVIIIIASSRKNKNGNDGGYPGQGGPGGPGGPAGPGGPGGQYAQGQYAQGQYAQPGQQGQPGPYAQPGQADPYAQPPTQQFASPPAPGQQGQYSQPGQADPYAQPGQPGQPGGYPQQGGYSQPGAPGSPQQPGGPDAPTQQFAPPPAPGQPGQPGAPGAPGPDQGPTQ